MMPITRQTLGSQDFPENPQKTLFATFSDAAKNPSKNPQKNPPPPLEILKNLQKTLPRPPKTIKKPSPETFLKVLAIECVTKGGARAQARAPPL